MNEPDLNDRNVVGWAIVLVTALLGSSVMLVILNAATLHWWR